jgi:hypothetical protein
VCGERKGSRDGFHYTMGHSGSGVVLMTVQAVVFIGLQCKSWKMRWLLGFLSLDSGIECAIFLFHLFFFDNLSPKISKIHLAPTIFLGFLFHFSDFNNFLRVSHRVAGALQGYTRLMILSE